jgi:hypothetical protein
MTGFRRVEIEMGKTRLPAPRIQEFAVKGGEQPGFHFGNIAQLMTFGCPNRECLLRQIAGIRLGARQTESKLK